MQIPGNALLAGLGLAQQAQQAPQKQPPAEERASAARKSVQTANRRPVQPRAQAPAGGPAAGLSRAQNLEQAVQALAEQGRLPPRGSLIDLRA